MASGEAADQPVRRFGRRCAIGCESWPDEDDYKTCPICGEVTTRYNNLLPLDSEEAASVANHARFEEFYENWCEKRGITVSGPIRFLKDAVKDRANAATS